MEREREKEQLDLRVCVLNLEPLAHTRTHTHTRSGEGENKGVMNAGQTDCHVRQGGSFFLSLSLTPSLAARKQENGTHEAVERSCGSRERERDSG